MVEFRSSNKRGEKTGESERKRNKARVDCGFIDGN
jgi:hypothetical protein